VGQSFARPSTGRKIFVWFQLILAYGLIECALWSPRITIRNRWALAAAIVIVIFLLIDRPSIRRMGLGLPSTLGASVVLAISFAVAIVMIFFVESIGGQIAPMPTWTTLYRSGGYVIWALLQELLLQSFFFTRCEDLFGSSAAVWVAATLFAAAHLPNLILMTLTLAGGLFFCEMFRRYRSIYPVGIVHAVLELTVAITMPDGLLHHMRAGIGFLQY
jgi:membrane protease YdiL (CAAX protease family)